MRSIFHDEREQVESEPRKDDEEGFQDAEEETSSLIFEDPLTLHQTQTIQKPKRVDRRSHRPARSESDDSSSGISNSISDGLNCLVDESNESLIESDGSHDSATSEAGNESSSIEECTVGKREGDEPLGEIAETEEDDSRVTDLNKANEYKCEGNEAFKNGLWDEAILAYNKGLDLTPREEKELAAQFFGNMAAVHIQMEKFEEALESCSSAIEIDPNYAKGYLRRYRANMKLDKLHDAATDLKKACDLDDKIRTSMSGELTMVQKRSEELFEKEKEEMVGKLKDFGNWALGKVGMSLDNFQVVQDPSTGSYNIKYTNNAPTTPH